MTAVIKGIKRNHSINRAGHHKHLISSTLSFKEDSANIKRKKIQSPTYNLVWTHPVTANTTDCLDPLVHEMLQNADTVTTSFIS